MSDQTTGAGPDGSALQFDQAEYDKQGAAGAACTMCKHPIPDSYYEINGKITCNGCKDKLERLISGGSGGKRFLKALVYGTLAGAVGAAIWYAVAQLTGYEIGIIAIVVGFLVGTAVKKGSEGRGGWKYQALAMFLTYSSIVSTYIPPMYAQIQAMREQKKAAVPHVEAAVSAEAGSAAETGDAKAKHGPLGKVVYFAFGMVVLYALALAAPVLAGFGNIIGILIIGFAVYEAWMLNKRLALSITGPYHVSTGESPPPIPQATA